MKTNYSKTIAGLILSSTLLSINAMADILPTSTINDSNPRLYFDDTRDTGTSDWYLGMFQHSNAQGIYIETDKSQNGTIQFLYWDDSVDQVAFGFNSMKFYTDTGSVFNSTSIGDISLADGSVFIDKSTNRLGVGTVTPSYPLHVVSSSNPGLFLDSPGYTQWRIDPGSNGLWFWDEMAGTYPVKVENGAPNDSLVVHSEGGISSAFSGSDTANNHNLLALSSNNGGTGNSDVGFSMENVETDFKWTFRTFNPGEGFAASKIGTGGTEFEVDNLGTTTGTTVVKMGGVTVFEGGALVTSSSRALKDNIKPLDTKAAMEALNKLQPVSYVYKKDRKNPVVGFIAEDVPELVAMPSHKTFNASEIVAVLTSVVKEQDKQLKAQAQKIERLEAMQKRLARVESLLTNLALETSNSKTEKVSLNSK